MDFGGDVFPQIAAILLVSALLGAIAARLRQPLIVAFVVVGILAGPSVTGVVQTEGTLELLAEIGVALLLFAVGLKLDLHVVRSLGRTVLVVGTAQVALTAGLGYPLALGLGLEPLPALYVALGLAFSSTIVVVKLLSDRREIDDLHGRLAVGVLIVQDLVVVVAMIGLSAAGEGGGAGSGLALVAAGGAAFLGGLAVLMRWVLEPLLHRLARLPELLVVFSIAWAVSLAAAGEALGIGTEVGAFLAGVSVASTPYREAVAARLVSVRDFLLLFFFIDLGARVDLGEIAGQLLPALALSLFVLVGKPLLVAGLLGTRGYRRRVSFSAGVPLAQISEFSLILAALGLGLGHLQEDTVGLMTAIALVTIAASTYLQLYAEWVYERISPALAWLERRPPAHEPDGRPPARPDVVVLGLGRYGSAIVEALQERDVAVLGVDYDPDALSAWEERGLDVRYGDAEDPELLQALPLPAAGWVVSTVRRVDANLALLHALRHHGYRGRVAVAANRVEDERRLEGAGADRVLRPYVEAAVSLVDVVGAATAAGSRTDASRAQA